MYVALEVQIAAISLEVASFKNSILTIIGVLKLAVETPTLDEAAVDSALSGAGWFI